MACVVVAAAIILSFLWGTAFTCPDDLFTATAWQRSGDGAPRPALTLEEACQAPPQRCPYLLDVIPRWPAIVRASWVSAVYQGRFYQVFAYTLAQVPYSFDSIPIANSFRIGSVAFVFCCFALMLKGLLKDFRLSLFFVLLSIALLQTGYAYNPFHALPLWFNLGAGLLFLAFFFFNESLSRKSRFLNAAAAVMYCGALLLYESFLCYGFLFFALSYVRSVENLPMRRLWRSLLGMSWIIAVTMAYLGCYFTFSAAHPTTYAGRSFSPAAPSAVLYTIFQFSISGLNFHSLLHANLQWSLKAAVMAVLVFTISFDGLRRYSPVLSGRCLTALAAWSVAGMCAPNVLYGFSERYRHWALAYNNYYLGSFYSAFAEAVLVGTLGLLAVKLSGFLRVKTAGVIGVAAIFSMAAYANIRDGDRLFAVHRENREYWRLVDSLVSDGKSGVTGPSAVIVAPVLQNLPYLDAASYDYWSFYFTGKLHFSVLVVGSPADYLLLPSKVRSTSPVFGLATKYLPDLKAGFAAIGPIDVGVWRNDPTRILTARANVTVVGDPKDLFVTFRAADSGQVFKSPATAQVMSSNSVPIDLSALILGH